MAPLEIDLIVLNTFLIYSVKQSFIVFTFWLTFIYFWIIFTLQSSQDLCWKIFYRAIFEWTKYIGHERTKRLDAETYPWWWSAVLKFIINWLSILDNIVSICLTFLNAILQWIFLSTNVKFTMTDDWSYLKKISRQLVRRLMENPSTYL